MLCALKTGVAYFQQCKTPKMKYSAPYHLTSDTGKRGSSRDFCYVIQKGLQEPFICKGIITFITNDQVIKYLDV